MFEYKITYLHNNQIKHKYLNTKKQMKKLIDGEYKIKNINKGITYYSDNISQNCIIKPGEYEIIENVDNEVDFIKLIISN